MHNWARWARTQTAAWDSTREPGGWDMIAAERQLAELAATTLLPDRSESA